MSLFYKYILIVPTQLISYCVRLGNKYTITNKQKEEESSLRNYPPVVYFKYHFLLWAKSITVDIHVEVRIAPCKFIAEETSRKKSIQHFLDDWFYVFNSLPFSSYSCFFSFWHIRSSNYEPSDNAHYFLILWRVILRLPIVGSLFLAQKIRWK